VSLRLRVRPAAQRDLQKAALWYDGQRPGLGNTFLSEFVAATGRISALPLAYPVVRRSVRRATLRRFPYSVFYTIDDDVVVVAALVHFSRDPSRWRYR
jgi:plasmid stabilization system protein ParE